MNRSGWKGPTFSETFVMLTFALAGLVLSAFTVRDEAMWGSLVVGLCAVLLVVCLVRLWRMNRG
jgi:hypothetical protein